MPPNQQNQYDFIMNNQPRPPRPGLNTNDIRIRFAIVLGIFVLVIILASVLMSFLSSSGNVQRDRLIEVAEAQNEIVRVSSLGREKTKDLSTRNLAINTRLSVQSALTDVKRLLAKRGVNEKEINKKLAASKNAKTDTTLEEAAQNNRFDETFTTLIEKQLDDYQKLMQTAYEGSTASEKKVLQAAFDSNALLAAKPEATQ